VQTFSIGFDDPRYDESRYALAVAKHLGTDHHQSVVRPIAAVDLPKLIEVFGEPFGDSSALPTHYLARETRKHVKVALSGDGGDELFGGYDRYRAIHLSQRVARLVPQLAATRAGRFAGGHPKSKVTRAARFVQSLSLPMAPRYSSFVRVFDDHLIGELMPGVSLGFDRVAEEFERALRAGARPAEAGLAADRVTYLPDDLLTKVDRASMMHGLEVRSPFMDHELVQFAAGLTTDQLLKGGPKRMLREAFAKDLPDFVFKRPKMGFAVPIGEWFRGELRPMLRDNLFAADSFGRQHFNMKVVERLVEEHETERIDHSQRLYALLMLELWWRWHRSI
jgi:asparagine synthase (glutamine-hydrolysing)